MATRHVVKPNGEHELKHIDIFAQNMVPYFQHRDYLDHTNYFSKGSNFVKDKLDKHLRNFNDLEGDLRRNDSEVFINNNGVYHGQQTKLKLREGSLLSDFMSSSKEINIEGKNEKLDMAQYFTLTNGLPSQRPLLFMQYPSVRHGTDTASFGKFPCSGGEKGPNKYYQPGSKIMVRWQIENPLSSGKCAIKLAENNPQNLSSYKALTPSNVNVDSDGYFSWGNLEQSSEGVEIAVPSDSSCVECTLQLVYKTQEFGEMYQCSDISTAYFETTNDCDKPWLNQGVCFKGQWVWAKGFFGQYWENLINPDVAAKGANQEYKTIKPELTKSTTKKNNGVKYLNYTPEAEKLNLENKTDKKSGNAN